MFLENLNIKTQADVDACMAKIDYWFDQDEHSYARELLDVMNAVDNVALKKDIQMKLKVSEKA